MGKRGVGLQLAVGNEASTSAQEGLVEEIGPTRAAQRLPTWGVVVDG